MEKTFVTFTLDDDPQEYKLFYDYNEVCEAEVVCDLNLFLPLYGLEAFNARTYRGVLYAFLKTAHPRVLLKEAGELITRDRRTVMDAMSEVTKALRAEAESDQEAEVNAASTAQ